MGLGLLTDQQPQSSRVLFQIGRFSQDESGSFENSLLDNQRGSSPRPQLVGASLLTGQPTTCDAWPSTTDSAWAATWEGILLGSTFYRDALSEETGLSSPVKSPGPCFHRSLIVLGP